MNQQSSANQLMDIALRIRTMRDILGNSTQKMAELTDVSETLYREYEAGTTDLPLPLCTSVPRSSVWKLPIF